MGIAPVGVSYCNGLVYAPKLCKGSLERDSVSAFWVSALNVCSTVIMAMLMVKF